MDSKSKIIIDYCNDGLSDNAIGINEITEYDCITVPQQPTNNNNFSTSNIKIQKHGESV